MGRAHTARVTLKKGSSLVARLAACNVRSAPTVMSLSCTPNEVPVGHSADGAA